MKDSIENQVGVHERSIADALRKEKSYNNESLVLLNKIAQVRQTNFDQKMQYMLQLVKEKTAAYQKALNAELRKSKSAVEARDSWQTVEVKASGQAEAKRLTAVTAAAFAFERAGSKLRIASEEQANKHTLVELGRSMAAAAKKLKLGLVEWEESSPQRFEEDQQEVEDKVKHFQEAQNRTDTVLASSESLRKELDALIASQEAAEKVREEAASAFQHHLLDVAHDASREALISWYHHEEELEREEASRIKAVPRAPEYYDELYAGLQTDGTFNDPNAPLVAREG